MKRFLYSALVVLSVVIFVVSLYHLLREIPVAYAVFSAPGESGLGGYATGMAIVILVYLLVLSAGGVHLGVNRFKNR